MKKVLFVVMGFLIGAGTIMCYVQAFESFWYDGSQPYVLEDFTSPNAVHSVKIVADGAPAWPFGPQSVHVEFDEILLTKSVLINTKGADFSKYEVLWDNETAFVTLDTSHNEQVIYEATFYGESVSVKMLTKTS